MSLNERIEMLYASIGAARHQLASLPAAKCRRTASGLEMFQDFAGDASPAQLKIELGTQIYYLGSFPDHLRKRLSEIGKKRRKDEVEDFFRKDRKFRIIYDLYNIDKHANPDNRRGGWSKESPELRNIRRPARPRTQAKAGSTAGVMMDMRGKVSAIGDGETLAITTGELFDKDGKALGFAHDFIEGAFAVCEAAVDYFGAR